MFKGMIKFACKSRKRGNGEAIENKDRGGKWIEETWCSESVMVGAPLFRQTTAH